MTDVIVYKCNNCDSIGVARMGELVPTAKCCDNVSIHAEGHNWYNSGASIFIPNGINAMNHPIVMQYSGAGVTDDLQEHINKCEQTALAQQPDDVVEAVRIAIWDSLRHDREMYCALTIDELNKAANAAINAYEASSKSALVANGYKE